MYEREIVPNLNGCSKVEYGLTEFGKTLIPVLGQWG